MTESKKIPINVSKEGSLGLLALGDVGLRAWRAARDNQNPNQTEDVEKK